MGQGCSSNGKHVADRPEKGGFGTNPVDNASDQILNESDIHKTRNL